jgi:transcriptional regulator with XRE-family HTH domain
MSAALGELTGRSDIESMTLLRMAPAFPGTRLLRARLAWCPNCLHGDFGTGVRPYIRLAWLVQAVTICNIHRVRLSEICSSCGTKQLVPAHTALPGYCSHCGYRLDQGAIDAKPPNVWDEWAAAQVSVVLASGLAEKLDVAVGITAACNQLTGGGLVAFAEALGEPKGAMSAWRSGRVRPTLPKLLRLCYLLGISLDDFLRGDFRVRLQPHRLASAPVATVPRHPVAHSVLINAMTETLRTTEVPNLHALGRSLGVDCNTLRLASPQLAGDIVQMRAKGTLVLRQRKLAAACQDVERAVRVVANTGAVPSWRRVAKVIGKSGRYLLKPAINRAYQKARAELAGPPHNNRTGNARKANKLGRI